MKKSIQVNKDVVRPKDDGKGHKLKGYDVIYSSTTPFLIFNVGILCKRSKFKNLDRHVVSLKGDGRIRKLKGYDTILLVFSFSNLPCWILL